MAGSLGGLEFMAQILPFPVDHGRRLTVLVVDDEPAIRGVLCEFLKECGFDALSAETADQALALIQGGVLIDLVFSDVRMPGGMDGCALARWILENRPALPVILTTGDLGKSDAGLSGVEVFAKPYDFDAAVRKIGDTIRHWKAQRLNQSDLQATKWSGALPAAQT